MMRLFHFNTSMQNINLWDLVNAAASASSCSSILGLPARTFFSDVSNVNGPVVCCVKSKSTTGLRRFRSTEAPSISFGARCHQQKSEGNEKNGAGYLPG